MAKNKKTGGRKPGSKTADREKLHAAIDKALGGSPDKLAEALTELALGVVIGEVNLEGVVVRAYKKAPDTKAIQTLVEQRYGRAPQTIDLGAQDPGAGFMLVISVPPQGTPEQFNKLAEKFAAKDSKRN